MASVVTLVATSDIAAKLKAMLTLSFGLEAQLWVFKYEDDRHLWCGHKREEKDADHIPGGKKGQCRNKFFNVKPHIKLPL